MLLLETLQTAWRALTANRLRTALTMLGIIIGVASVVAMLALGEGARASVESSIKSLGTNLLFIRPSSASSRGVSGGSMQTMTLDDAAAIAKIAGVVRVAPEANANAQAKYFANNENASVVGSTPDYFAVRNFTVANGALFTAADEQAGRRVAVLGGTIAANLFGGLDPVGDRIQLKGRTFTVIGVLTVKGQAGFSNPDEQIVVPLTALQRSLSGNDRLGSISTQLDDAANATTVQEDITRLLRARHKLADSDEDDFRISTQAEMLETMNQVTGVFTALLGGVAAVSLLVGGIGIMNIMLVSVRERTREIGIRKAVGARNQDILVQFLIESVVVSVFGGILGLLLGYLIAVVFASLTSTPTTVPMYAMVLSLATSGGIGIVFGVWPARVAAKLNPVDALRYE